MAPHSDRPLRRPGRVTAALVLGAVALLGLLTLLVIRLRLFEDGSSIRGVTDEKGAVETRAVIVRYDAPATVVGTRTQLVAIHEGAVAGSRGGYSSYGGEARGPLVNVVFLDPDRPQGRLLLDRPAFITGLHYPRPGSDGTRAPAEAEDSLQTWISYEIVFADSDGDGGLDRGDDASLYVSALDGTGFRRVTPDGLDVVSHTARPDGRSILVLALERPARGGPVPRSELRQRAFVYDLPSSTLRPFAALEAPAARAAQIVGR